MSNNYWIKLYHEILDDPKMGRLSDSAYRRCIELFLMAGRDGNDDGTLPDFDDIAWKLRVSNQQLQQDLAELEAAGIVEIVDGNPFVTNFAKRQAKISNAEKQKAYRERKRMEELETSDADDTAPLPDSYQAVTDGNAEKNRVEKNRVDESAHDNDLTPQEQIITHFETLTHINGSMQGASIYKSKWWHPADAIYLVCGMDLLLAKQAVTEAVKILKAKGYTFSSLASVQSTAVNWIDQNNNSRKSSLDETWVNLWLPAFSNSTIIQEWPEEEKQKLRAIGGQQILVKNQPSDVKRMLMSLNGAHS